MGSAQQIKSRYGQGLELNIRLNPPLIDQPLATLNTEAQAQQEVQAIQEKKHVFEQGLATVLQQETTSPGMSLLEGSGTSFRYQIFPAALEGRFKSLGALFQLLE